MHRSREEFVYRNVEAVHPHWGLLLAGADRISQHCGFHQLEEMQDKLSLSSVQPWNVRVCILGTFGSYGRKFAQCEDA
jgi:hypothetical protein